MRLSVRPAAAAGLRMSVRSKGEDMKAGLERGWSMEEGGWALVL